VGRPCSFTGLNLFDAQLADPGGEVVVFVTEPLTEAKPQLTELDLAGVVAETRASDIGDAVLGAVDDEAVQVFTAPAEHRLQDRVQLGDRGVGGHQQSPPDQRADSGDHHPQPIYHRRSTDSGIGTAHDLGHPLILARYPGIGAGRRRYW
jgi:hypothetical protein